MGPDRGLDKYQVAYRLGVSPRTVEDPRWRLRVGLRGFRVGRSLRFREGEILQFLERSQERLTDDPRVSFAHQR